MQANAPGGRTHRFAQSHVQVTPDAAINSHLGHGHTAHRVDAPFGVKHRDGCAVLRHRHGGPCGGVIGPGDRVDGLQLEPITAHTGSFARLHADIVFTLKAADHRDPDDEHRDTKMRQQHAVIATRLCCHAGAPARCRMFAQPGDQVKNRRAGDPNRQQQPQTGHGGPVAQHQGGDDRTGQAHPNGPPQSTRQVGGTGLTPACQGTHAHQEQCRRDQRDKHGREIRGADRQLAQAQGIDHQGVERAQQHCSGRHHQQHIIGQQHGLARDRGESSAQPHARRTPGKQRQ